MMERDRLRKTVFEQAVTIAELVAGLRKIRGHVGHHGLVPAERNVVCDHIDALLAKVKEENRVASA